MILRILKLEKYEYKPLISVIIPVFNTEKYIRQCLESVVTQSYTNIEIICVDDASSDGSGLIINEFRNEDPRIKILINDSNIGAGLSRNKGLDYSKGEYIFFLDSDDYLLQGSLECLVNIINRYNLPEVICFKSELFDCKTNKKFYVRQIPDKYVNKLINIYSCPDSIEYINYEVTKLYRKDFLINNNIKFPPYKSLEDVEQTLDVMLSAKNIILTNDEVYAYRKNRPNSVVSNGKYHIIALVEAVKKANICSENFAPEVRHALLIKLYRTLCESAHISYCCRILSFDELKNIFKENIDLTVFETEGQKYYIKMYGNLMKDSAYLFRIKSFKKLLILRFQRLFNVYKKIKNRLHFK